MDPSDDQQFCLRWNNFQANITSQFETLRDDEDFIDVTIACEGQRLQAHKVVLSACSPFFKDLFKNNPCSHPIIFMRDVEASHIVALLEFMYAGEVNVAQAQLSGFLKTAESLRIRGLTDTSPDLNPKDEDTPFLDQDPLLPHKKHQNIAYNSAVTSSQDIRLDKQVASSPPPNKKQSSQESDLHLLQTQLEDAHLQRLTQAEDTLLANAIALGDARDFDIDNKSIQPKLENPDYLSDEDRDEPKNYFHNVTTSSIIGGMEIIPHLGGKDPASDNVGTDGRKLHSLDPRRCEECGRVYSNLSNLIQHMKLIHYPTQVSCPFCTNPFKTDLNLSRHISASQVSDPFILNSSEYLNNTSTTIYNKYGGLERVTLGPNVSSSKENCCREHIAKIRAIKSDYKSQGNIFKKYYK